MTAVKTDWFKSWFDSPYYHILYKHRDQEEAKHFIDNLIDFLKPASNAELLDLACGKGRHSIYLNSKGLDVTGVDLSPESIKYASQFENEHLSFFVQDMRRVFRVNYFDYIFNLFTSFGYFSKDSDNYAAIAAMATALKFDGVLVMDFMNVQKVTDNLVGEQVITNDGIEFHITRMVKDGFIVKEIKFTDIGEDYLFHEQVKAITLDDFKYYFDKAKLKIVNLFGDYNLNAFDTHTSDRLILIARKA
jgi:SAM-dependent methyltransferase